MVHQNCPLRVEPAAADLRDKRRRGKIQLDKFMEGVATLGAEPANQKL